MSAEISCPRCHHEHAAPVQITAEPSRHAAKRPATPEVIHLCRKCNAVLVLALHLAPREASAA
jgi:hypothetical protein